MKLKSSIFVLIPFLFASSIKCEDLKSRHDLLYDRYTADRAKGLKALNQRYIESFKLELDSAMKAGRLEDATVIKGLIETLEEEINSLENPNPSVSSSPDQSVKSDREMKQWLETLEFRLANGATWIVKDDTVVQTIPDGTTYRYELESVTQDSFTYGNQTGKTTITIRTDNTALWKSEGRNELKLTWEQRPNR